jgi:hypothetical protein
LRVRRKLGCLCSFKALSGRNNRLKRVANIDLHGFDNLTLSRVKLALLRK